MYVQLIVAVAPSLIPQPYITQEQRARARRARLIRVSTDALTLVQSIVHHNLDATAMKHFLTLSRQVMSAPTLTESYELLRSTPDPLHSGQSVFDALQHPPHDMHREAMMFLCSALIVPSIGGSWLTRRRFPKHVQRKFDDDEFIREHGGVQAMSEEQVREACSSRFLTDGFSGDRHLLDEWLALSKRDGRAAVVPLGVVSAVRCVSRDATMSVFCSLFLHKYKKG